MADAIRDLAGSLEITAMRRSIIMAVTDYTVDSCFEGGLRLLQEAEETTTKSTGLETTVIKALTN